MDRSELSHFVFPQPEPVTSNLAFHSPSASISKALTVRSIANRYAISLLFQVF